jgi:hypothetical protein
LLVLAGGGGPVNLVLLGGSAIDGDAPVDAYIIHRRGPTTAISKLK